MIEPSLNLPLDIAAALEPLFAVLPFSMALASLKLPTPVYEETVIRVIADPAIVGNPPLIAGMWLYAGDIWKSHTVSQSIGDFTGSWWHGIMHRLEGDYYNSRYWMQKAAGHPLQIIRPDLEPIAFVDAVEKSNDANSLQLIDRQREEWKTLFEWCAIQ